MPTRYNSLGGKYFPLAFVLHVRYGIPLGMKDERNSPWTFRPDPDVESLAERTLEALGWSKAKLLNESVRIAVPLLIGQARERLDAFGEVETKSASELRETAKRAAERAKHGTGRAVKS